MWFHNLQLYRLPTPWTITADQLREQLGRFIPALVAALGGEVSND